MGQYIEKKFICGYTLKLCNGLPGPSPFNNHIQMVQDCATRSVLSLYGYLIMTYLDWETSGPKKFYPDKAHFQD